ncbi:THUMP domain-containing class I SAM-dependent RNA methyltransferase [Acetivibrio mesophilus]|uniref:Class I SAM-dependent RNA methyltransferase n=1 Tax=Acetivibrio mesophilus TaxID=2487273 RepID=A0A4Q0I1E4_9FIRM|nr:class I SAM-dependent RNA methyltransferase [Acetivibrio mesophilus]RXE57911.1 class I SAM-dependent RNA methyltransferase [Acetivibrio mesophilus]HHV28737.1 class I SAM-dependent RNA methyltransferase [Clostridium sp.]
MKEVELIATAAAGVESAVKSEVIKLGYKDVVVENGKIMFKGDISSIPRANLWLRSADRVLLKIGEFEALTFEELFNKTFALPWDEWITRDGKFTVLGKSVKSKLFSISDSQAIVKKAVVEKLKSKYNVDWFEENGPEYTIQVSLHKDIATLTIDTSGTALHKRGYRAKNVEAPIKETLASAMIMISYWNKSKPFLDCFCGSGTIPIEAALIGRNIAPGLNRTFASEEWPVIGKDIWKQERVAALKAINQDINLKIYASDINTDAIELAKENAYLAGVDDCIEFVVSDFRDIRIKEDYGVIICNPPYGERISEQQEVEIINRDMGKVFSRYDTWSKYIITSSENFEQLYGKKADKKRKFYNGNIKVDYYQYFGPKPGSI